MRECNETVTVFNARWEAQSGGYVYLPTVVRGVGWHAGLAEAVDGRGGRVTANRIVARIPGDADAGEKAYVDPVAWRAAEDVSGLWTLAGGDIIVKGEAAGDGWTPGELKAAFAERMTVLGVTDNRGRPLGGHWKVVGE